MWCLHKLFAPKDPAVYHLCVCVCVCAGGVTGASARITGAVGDVFAKLSFDDEFISKRQQQKAKPPKMGSKLGGFAKVHNCKRDLFC